MNKKSKNILVWESFKKPSFVYEKYFMNKKIKLCLNIKKVSFIR
ncbi:Hypothetical Protein SLY_0841 [Strawberry lethal yellows phytoplasma (CPA) str. NZSb11]|uniref:Uncharacterized protein n=1 Tax=Strawberry lethal yellows phytoplasma (CPA) str. NZSb11 TaxID=980422 RepID=R4RQH2_PHYAS|nr:Hypothetical Protein SLY_0841 [Strawberry lethal yellows phytoplasma (CPA) str. NZSb11]